VVEGDLVELYIGDEFFGEVSDADLYLKAPPSLDIVYEDENILLMDKKPGLLVHPERRKRSTPSPPGCSPIFIKKGNTILKRKIPLRPPSATGWTAIPAGS
jgi:hypothetical protein